VSAPARLLALRMQGFKSFAERTLVEFGPGISAVVGPNGSGKSNLADALRWALGEQGRALRTRRSEDVIFAGSERRAALGMADVTILLDNGDGLLPVEYGTVELGRRLYRSGENDYLLNRSRVRLRDLVDLLDGAHLSDNAFLFIGQGMVDQALALRPEERRPLFEEVAGVRRHERRRRRAEDQLAEAEANLARIEDIVAELRPQVRRLAAQAEQQSTRQSAGDDLAAAVILSAHARWHGAALRVATAADGRDRARRDADRAMAILSEREDHVGRLASELAARATEEAAQRETHDAARAALTSLQLEEARLTGDLAALGRDRERLQAERGAAESELSERRRALAVPVPPRDLEAEAALGEAERALSDALAELATLRAARQARGEQLAALRRAEAARQAERDLAARRLADAERRADETAAGSRAVAERVAHLERERAAAADALEAGLDRERAAAARAEVARAEVERADAAARGAADRAASAREASSALRGRLDALDRWLAEEESRGIARAARRRGGRRIDEDLQVDPPLRAAVEAALGDVARAYLLSAESLGSIVDERGTVVIIERSAGAPEPGRHEAALRERATALGGGILADAIRRDGLGATRHLLARAAWVPDLGAAMALQPDLPPGWVAVLRDGTAVVGPLAVALGRPDGILERRSERDRLQAEAARSELVLAEAQAEADAAAATAAATRSALADVRRVEGEATAARRSAEEAERAASRSLEAAARELAWHAAQADRLRVEVERAQEALLGLADAPASREVGPGPEGTDEAALAIWETRAEELRARRDRLAAQARDADSARRDVEARRARAEASAALAEDRIAGSDRALAGLAEREASLRATLATLEADLAAAVDAETVARRVLTELRAADGVDRERISSAESEAAAARERLRAADDRVRAADVADLEARLALDAIREGVLVELAGLGSPGIRHLALAAGDTVRGTGPATRAEDGSASVAGPAGRASVDGEVAVDVDEASRSEVEDADAEGLEALLAVAAERWRTEPAPTEPPSAGRLAMLRRRYHELGAANPFAVDEYAAVRSRLESLERQDADLREAIAKTRGLISDLNELISEQFRATFRALESAFDRRFQQLFGGGFARLSLTDPADLAATGVEIVARPPGKKAQNLAMLSGGERALTAVALLFAMLEVRPVPFCVLDEVDAALDEANVGRFTEALRGLAEATQFIVITHNRGTIESADALYGVTVGDDSVSRVISLRLEEAREIADGVRAADARIVG
jgi:chromosome segregation protein